jgi:hypothetical protein
MQLSSKLLFSSYINDIGYSSYMLNFSTYIYIWLRYLPEGRVAVTEKRAK